MRWLRRRKHVADLALLRSELIDEALRIRLEHLEQEEEQEARVQNLRRALGIIEAGNLDDEDDTAFAERARKTAREVLLETNAPAPRMIGLAHPFQEHENRANRRKKY